MSLICSSPFLSSRLIRSLTITTTIALGLLSAGVGQAQESSNPVNTSRAAYQESLNTARQNGSLKDEAYSLLMMGYLDMRQQQPSQALDELKQSLVIYRELRDPGLTIHELDVLDDLGSVFMDLGRYDEQSEVLKQELECARTAKDLSHEAYALQDMGNLYGNLGQRQKALDFVRQAYAIYRKMDAREDEARALMVLGYYESLLGRRKEAISLLRKAMASSRTFSNHNLQQGVLADLCRVYGTSTRKLSAADGQSAVGYCSRSLKIAEASGDVENQASVLTLIGEVYQARHQHHEARHALYQALFMSGQKAQPDVLAHILFVLFKEYKRSSPAIAIYYGKQSVNYTQRSRQKMGRLAADLQESYLNGNEDRYRALADLLIADGRLPEAEETLNLLKEHEFAGYIRGENAAAPSGLLNYTPAEEEAASEYERSTKLLVSKGEEYTRLKLVVDRSPEQEAAYQRLSTDLSTGSKALDDFYGRLYVVLGENTQANRQIGDVKSVAAQLRHQIISSPHTVALYTLVTRDRYSVLLITGGTIIAHEYRIAEDILDTKIIEFRHALQDPLRDPRPSALELYRILVAPIQADLDQAAAQTIIWSLDGALRYIPMAALYDGSHFLVERYNSVNFTPAGVSYLADKPELGNVEAIAMGISQQIDQQLAALPGVAIELREIVREPGTTGEGILPGAVLLDGAFTERGMEQELNGQRKVVHIASHFVSRPGDDQRSYLLLAGKEEGAPGGFHLTVADFRDDQRITLENTDLLTLSACDTGLSGKDNDGREVDGLTTTAQMKGAKSVLSSLWGVNDASTAIFMADFYRRWVYGGGGVTKTQAIREAQLDLLQGRKQPKQAVHFVANDELLFSHPYYWAPFVLVGNWK